MQEQVNKTKLISSQNVFLMASVVKKTKNSGTYRKLRKLHFPQTTYVSVYLKYPRETVILSSVNLHEPNTWSLQVARVTQASLMWVDTVDLVGKY